MATNPSTAAPISQPAAEDKDDLQRIFNRYDANGDGKISASELSEVMRALGSAPSADELRRAMKEIDADGDGLIDLKEFTEFHRGGGGGGSEIRDAFEMYDLDGDGKISARELHRVLKSLGDRCSIEECSRMIRSVDSDGDGCVDFAEFKKMMSSGKTTAASTSGASFSSSR